MNALLSAPSNVGLVAVMLFTLIGVALVVIVCLLAHSKKSGIPDPQPAVHRDFVVIHQYIKICCTQNGGSCNNAEPADGGAEDAEK